MDEHRDDLQAAAMPAGGYSGVHRRTGYKSITQHKARSPNQGSGHLFVLSHLQLAARRVCMEQGFSLCLGASDALRGAVRLIVALRLFCVEQVLDLLFDVCFRRSALSELGSAASSSVAAVNRAFTSIRAAFMRAVSIFCLMVMF